MYFGANQALHNLKSHATMRPMESTLPAVLNTGFGRCHHHHGRIGRSIRAGLVV